MTTAAGTIASMSARLELTHTLSSLRAFPSDPTLAKYSGSESVVGLTAHAMKGDMERGLSAGMDGYLTKPIRPQELDDVLDKYAG
jgi:CheY-like chemotaxis protein